MATLKKTSERLRAKRTTIRTNVKPRSSDETHCAFSTLKAININATESFSVRLGTVV